MAYYVSQSSIDRSTKPDNTPTPKILSSTLLSHTTAGDLGVLCIVKCRWEHITEQ